MTYLCESVFKGVNLSLKCQAKMLFVLVFVLYSWHFCANRFLFLFFVVKMGEQYGV